jgi:hypothetical protein
MDITIYLPDELGERAKRADLNLSRMLRGQVEEELERRAAVAQTLDNPQTYELELEDPDTFRRYTGRVTGRKIAEDEQIEVFLTEDERVIVYDGGRPDYRVLEDPEEELRGLPAAEYASALSALGIKPVIDL